MDGTLLLIFRELLKHKRASAVAQRLGFSQSAVSHALTRLRELFGDPLFIRRSHGLEPTRRALELGPRVEALIDLISATVSSDGKFDPSESRRRFAIAAPDYLMSLLADRLVARFAREAPNATFAARHAILDRALAALRRGEFDLALGVFKEIPLGLKSEKLYDDEYCILVRRGHPRVRNKLDRKLYATIGHVFVGTPDGSLSDSPPLDREMINVTYGSMPSPSLVRTHGYVPAWETAMLIASNSDALVECPRRLAERYARALGLRIFDSPFAPFRFTVRAVWRDAQDPAVDWMRAQLRGALADNAAAA